jgi:hypothetical protein
MDFFGGINHLKVGRKCPYYLHCHWRIKVAYKVRQAFTRPFIILTVADGALASTFYQLEQLVAPLIPKQVSNQRAERSNIIAKWLILLLEGDVLSS